MSDSPLPKKRFRKVAEFWMNVGAVAHHNGPERETLFKNLHTEYQRIK